MKNRQRPVPSFPAATSTIEAQPEAVFHPGTEVLAAEAAHHEAVDAAVATGTIENPFETPSASLGGNDDSAASLSAGRGNALCDLDPVEVLRTPTPPTLKEIESAYVPAPALDPLTAHINALLGEEEPSEDSDMERFEAELNIAAELKTFMGDGIVDLPDGGILTTIKVDADKKTILMAWADGAGESFPDYLQKILEMGLEAVVNGGAVAG